MKRFAILFLVVLAVLVSSAQADPARCFKVFSHASDTAADTFEVTAFESGDYVIGVVKHTDYSTSSVAARISFETAFADSMVLMAAMKEATTGDYVALSTGSGNINIAAGLYPSITSAASQDYCVGDKLYVIWDPQDSDGGWVTLYLCVKRE